MFGWVKTFFTEFQTFASRGNFLDLAVGFVIGASFNAVTTSLVTNIITPPLGLLLGKINFSDLAIPLGGTVKISYGLFIQSVISFVITALALFIMVRFINKLEKIAQAQRHAEASEPPTAADSPEVAILKEIRDALRPGGPTTPEHPAPAPVDAPKRG
jgi:large conductance mechanosensitive channel